jgi:hypothetical protein
LENANWKLKISNWIFVNWVNLKVKCERLKVKMADELLLVSLLLSRFRCRFRPHTKKEYIIISSFLLELRIPEYFYNFNFEF